MHEKQKLSRIDRWNKIGMMLPMAHDSVTGKPSITLLGVHIALILTVVSLVALHFYPVELASGFCMGFYALTTVFYLMRRLQHAKFDLKDKDFELDSGEKNVPNDSTK